VAVREAVPKANAADIQDLADIVGAMDQALAAGKLDDWADLNTRFHLAFSRLASMPMLEEMMVQVLNRWERVRRYYFSGVLVHRVERAQAEHRAMLVAMKQRNTRRLEEIVRQHNQGALADYGAYLEDNKPASGSS
jgi:DNA-binding GntR family transcriptional regulator